MADLDLDDAVAVAVFLEEEQQPESAEVVDALVAEVRRLRALRDAAAELMNEVLTQDFSLDPAEAALKAALDACEEAGRG